MSRKDEIRQALLGIEEIEINVAEDDFSILKELLQSDNKRIVANSIFVLASNYAPNTKEIIEEYSSSDEKAVRITCLKCLQYTDSEFQHYMLTKFADSEGSKSIKKIGARLAFDLNLENDAQKFL